MNDTDASMSTSVTPASRRQIDRLPYLPGLDGLRAVAVVAVMIYHANHKWLSGGFLGVEVFFVISGYLITLLLIGEYDRDGHIRLAQFWKRRFRRLLPPLFVVLAGLAVFMAAFRRTPMGRTRGDFAGGLFYVSNWYQIIVGQGYTANEAFVPLRHLWSLAVEEQFYLIWPLVMVAVLIRRSGRDLPRMALWFAGISVAITLGVGLLFHSGDVAATCTATQRQGYWTLLGRCVSINEALYLGTISRAGGLLLGAAFAMVWRPMAILRGPLRDKAHTLDVIGLLGLVLLGWLSWTLWLSEGGRQFGIRFDAALFRGGFLLTGVATLMVIAAVTHQRSLLGRGLGDADLELDRHSKLRLVPLPLADLPDHSRRSRAGAQACAIHLGDCPDAADHGSELPLRRAADPPGSDRRDVARPTATEISCLGSTATTRDRRVVGRGWCRRFRRRQHRVGPEHLRRSGRMRSRQRNRHQRLAPHRPAHRRSTLSLRRRTVAAPSVAPQSTNSTTSTSSTTTTTLPVDQRPPIRDRRVRDARRQVAVGGKGLQGRRRGEPSGQGGRQPSCPSARRWSTRSKSW